MSEGHVYQADRCQMCVLWGWGAPRRNTFPIGCINEDGERESE